jgi:hypothetical protein
MHVPPILSFVILAILLWIGVCLAAGLLSGWLKLSARYRATTAAHGRRHRYVSARFGWVNYNHLLHVQVNDAGMHLSVAPVFAVAHPPLFVPWQDVRCTRIRRTLFGERVTLRIGEPNEATIEFPRRIIEGVNAIAVESAGQ